MSVKRNHEAADKENAEWSLCLAIGFGSFGLSALILVCLIVLVDPYDRGYFGLLHIVGVDDQTVTGNAGRARNPQFDSAIVSNSTGQLIDPDKLSGATGYRFVQLLVPGGEPSGLLATLDYFVRYHKQVGVLVLVIDDPWCGLTAKSGLNDPFPYWLYSDSIFGYASHLWNWAAIDHLIRRIQIGLGIRTPMRADGHWSYEDIYPQDQQPPADRDLKNVEPDLDDSANGVRHRERLAAAIAKLPESTIVILVMPPVFYTDLPAPQTRKAAIRDACKAGYHSIASARARARLIDYRTDNTSTRDPRNFLDLIHYRQGLANEIAESIVANIGFARSSGP